MDGASFARSEAPHVYTFVESETYFLKLTCRCNAVVLNTRRMCTLCGPHCRNKQHAGVMAAGQLLHCTKYKSVSLATVVLGHPRTHSQMVIDTDFPCSHVAVSVPCGNAVQ